LREVLLVEQTAVLPQLKHVFAMPYSEYVS
jgi:hypothetical protein